MESLASFYEACAQIEIDEFRDYDKVLDPYTRPGIDRLTSYIFSSHTFHALGCEVGRN